MYHVGRPGEDGFTERVLAAWGVDGHNSHTNVCSSGARAGYHFWMGIDRPSPDHANAEVILLISSHLEAGHYFNPHAQRIIEAKAARRQADRPRHAPVEHRHARRPLAVALAGLGGRDPARDREPPDRAPAATTASSCAAGGTGRNTSPPSTRIAPRDLRDLRARSSHELYADFTFEFAAHESGVDAAVIAQVAEIVADAGTRLSTHTWRSAAAGNLGGWQVSRTLFLLNACWVRWPRQGGTHPNAWNKFVPKPIHLPPHPRDWNELTWPRSTRSRSTSCRSCCRTSSRRVGARLDVYFTRVYNPVWTNPDGFSWIEALTDESPRRAARRPHADLERDGLLRRLRPADGPRLGAPRRPLLRAVRRPVDRLPPAGAARRARASWARRSTDTRAGQPRRGLGGERVLDRAVLADRSATARLGHPQASSSRASARARSSASTSTTAGCSSTRCPACPRRRPPRA